MNIGRAIRLGRTARGISRSKLAEAVGVSVSHISLLESGKRDPSVGLLERIARALNTSPIILAFVAAEPGELAGFDDKSKEILNALALELMKDV